jgi:hypothetical protein
MTAYTKLAVLFAGAFLLLAQSSDAAQAGHRQTDRQAKKARIAQYWNQQRTHNYDRQGGGNQAYLHGRSYGQRGRLYYQQNGDFYRHKAYGYRARQYYQNGGGQYWSRRDGHENAYRRYGGGDFRQHRHRDGQQARNFFFGGNRDGTRQRHSGQFRDGVRDHDRRSDGEAQVHRRGNSDDD